MHIGTGIIYSNALGTFVKPIIKRNFNKSYLVDEINEIVYPNGDRELFILLDAKNVKSLKIRESLDDTMIKLVKDFQDSLDMLEKRFLAKRLTDLYQEKYTIAIVFLLGMAMGYIISKAIH